MLDWEWKNCLLTEERPKPPELNDPCSICFESATNPVSTPCKHLFCLSCIDTWIKTGKETCPLCRSRLEWINRFSTEEEGYDTVH